MHSVIGFVSRPYHENLKEKPRDAVFLPSSPSFAHETRDARSFLVKVQLFWALSMKAVSLILI